MTVIPDIASDQSERLKSRRKTPLRVAVALPSVTKMAVWQQRLIDRIQCDNLFYLAAVLDCPNAAPRSTGLGLFAVMAKLEAKIFARVPPYDPKSGRKIFALDLPQLHCRTAENDIEGLHALIDPLQIDLIINLTGASLPAEILTSIRHGEWRFNFSDETSNQADWFGYAPVINRAPATELILCAKDWHGHVSHIASASFNIKFSGARNNAYVKERAVTLLAREMRSLALDGKPNIKIKPVSPSTAAPTHRQMLRYVYAFSSQLMRRVRQSVTQKLGRETAVWTLFTGRGSIENFEPSTAQEIPPENDDIKADPFLFTHEDESYLFYEAYGAGDKNAHIAVGQFQNDKLVPLGPVLQQPYHLSYPLIFRDGDDIFMMPETHAAQRIEVWRCVNFPMKWELHSTAFEGQSAADSVLLKLGSQWWLFTNMSDYHAYEDHCCELHVFQVDGPALKEIEPHRHNPVVLGSLDARNAGRIVEQGGRLFRPSQRNAYGIYGYGLNIMEIDELSLTDYREHCVRTIIPNFKSEIFGCHHFDADGERYVIDARVSA